MKRQRTRIWAGVTAAALGVMLLVAVPSVTASAVGSNDLLVRSVGSFSSPSRPDGTTAPLCVNYGTGDPATFSPTNNQSTAWGASNQVRSGTQLSVLSSPTPPCWPSPEQSSGLGFEGITAASPVGEYFEIGRFTHFNNTIQNGLHWVNLDASMTITNPYTLAQEQLDASYRIRLQESPEQFQLPGDPVPTTADCQFQPGETNSFAGGTTVPAYVNGYNTGPASFTFNDPNLPSSLNPVTTQRVACADSLYVVPVDPTDPSETLTWGETSVRVGIGGWAPVVGGTCDSTNVLAGPVVYTPESETTMLCMLGRIIPATISVEKLVEDMPDGEFGFELVEQDQGQDPPVDDPSRSTEFSITTSGGTGTLDLGEIEPGLYRLTETNVPDGYELNDLSCVDADDESIITTGGFLDLDSGVAATCRFVNGPVTTAGLTLSKQVDLGAAEPTAWTLSASGPSTISGAAGAASVTDARVAPGEYSLTESGGPAGYEQTGLVCLDDEQTEVPLTDGNRITLAAGQEVTCTFTNTTTMGTLTLVKEVASGSAAPSAWTLTADGPTPITGRSGAASVTAASVAAGVYTLTESEGPAGYQQQSLACANGANAVAIEGAQLRIAPGADVTCTFTNSEQSTAGGASGPAGLANTGSSFPVWPVLGGVLALLLLGGGAMWAGTRRKEDLTERSPR